MLYKTYYNSCLGRILLVSDGEKLVMLTFECHRFYPDAFSSKMEVKDSLLIFQKTKNWLDRYFNGEKPSLQELSLAPVGTAFRQTVWKILCDVPYGKVITYGEIARKVAFLQGKKSMSAQAVGNAVGHNPISIIIPCHRVVGANRSLTGYGGGLRNKIKLLELEGVMVDDYKVPTRGTAL